MRNNTNRQSNATRLAGPIVTGLLAVLVVGALVYKQQQTITSLNLQVASLEAQVEDLQQRWYGTPALWQPPAINNTDIKYFDVKGTTQAQLIDSLDHSNICQQYGPCAPDPAVPKGVAWGLAGFDAVGTTFACYSPATTELSFREYIVIPRWAPPTDGSVKISLIERWNALEKVIYTHEAGHIAIDQKDLADLNSKAQQLSTCDEVGQFWANVHVYDQLNADQAAYHARLHANCKPEVGCLPPDWMGW